MAFHFVDRIYDLQHGKQARGLKNATRNESFYYQLPNGERVLSPAVLTEALAQLGAWLKMSTTDFTKRPVLLADEFSYYGGTVKAGDQVDLQVDIVEFNDDVVISKSFAEVAGKRILTVECCRGYMLPMEEFDERSRVINQYHRLFRPRTTDVMSSPPVNLLSMNTDLEVRPLMFVDGVVEHSPHKKVVAYKNFAACEPYFQSHFPYKPVVPGVLLMTFIGEVAQFLLRDELGVAQLDKVLLPTYVRNARFRKFVEPGDQCLLTVEVKSGSMSDDAQDIEVSAHMVANHKRVMLADMGFRTMFGKNSAAFKRALPFAS